jgi:hypothetical protein
METIIIFPAGASPESYEVVKETAKAIQLRCISTQNKTFPVWVPKAAIIKETVKLPGVTETLNHFAKWFTPEKAWQRVSLGMTTY